MPRGRPKGSKNSEPKKEVVPEISEERNKILYEERVLDPEKDEIEIKKLRTISNLGEVQMLIATGQTIFKSQGIMADKTPISADDVMKLPLGTILKMLKEYKLHRY